MLQVSVEAGELGSNKRKTQRRKDKETCPLCHKVEGGADWQQCTQPHPTSGCNTDAKQPGTRHTYFQNAEICRIFAAVENNCY